MEEKIIWSRAAAKDIEHIYNYISKDSKLYAGRFIDEIDNKIIALVHQPHMGRIVPEKGNEHIREVFHGNYRIMYAIHKLPDIIIYRIIHSAQNY